MATNKKKATGPQLTKRIEDIMEAQLRECRATHKQLRENLESEIMEQVKALVTRADENKKAIAEIRHTHLQEFGAIVQTQNTLVAQMTKLSFITIDDQGTTKELHEIIADIYDSTRPERATATFKRGLTQWQADTVAGRFFASRKGKATILLLVLLGSIGAFHLLVVHTKETFDWLSKILGIAK